MVAEAIRQMVLPGWVLALSSLLPSRKLRRAKVVVDEFLEQCVAVRLKERATTGRDDTTDMLQILLDAESKGLISRDDVKGQLLTFIFAGKRGMFELLGGCLPTANY